MLWLTARDIEIVHSMQMEAHGGLPGVRDDNALASTVARPQQLLNYDPKATVFEMAASLGFGFARNHVFNDGNKRVAFLSMFLFLGANDLRLNVAEEEAVMMTLALAAGEIAEPELAAWLETYSDPWMD